MDRLPDALQLEILNHLNGDATDLARCRLVSKTLNTLSYDVRSLNIFFSRELYFKSRAPESQITPFKTIVKKLLLRSKNLESISIGFADLLDIDHVGNNSDDLHLMAVDFVSEWLSEISPRLKWISISDFIFQSYWRVSKILSLISSTCNNLVELTLKNAYLSVEGLKPMMMLTSLTLQNIILHDEDLNIVNECFPSLRVLKLIRIFGLRAPKIHFRHLQKCTIIFTWPVDLLSIDTPNLTYLIVTCKPLMGLVLKAPLLSFLVFCIEKASVVLLKAEKLTNLKMLKIGGSFDLCNLIKLFSVCKGVEHLMVDWTKWDGELKPIIIATATCEELMSSFPNVSFLLFRFGVRIEFLMWFVQRGCEARNGWKRLRKMVVCFDTKFLVSEMETAHAFISHIMKQCPTLTAMKYEYSGISSDVASNLICLQLYG